MKALVLVNVCLKNKAFLVRVQALQKVLSTFSTRQTFLGMEYLLDLQRDNSQTRDKRQKIWWI